MAGSDTAKILAAIGKLEAQVDGLRHDVDGLRRELHTEVNALRQEMCQEMRAMEARLSGDAARQLAATWSVNLAVSRPNVRSTSGLAASCLWTVGCTA